MDIVGVEWGLGFVGVVDCGDDDCWIGGGDCGGDFGSVVVNVDDILN